MGEWNRNLGNFSHLYPESLSESDLVDIFLF